MLKNLFKGQMLVELLLTIGLAAIIFPALLTGFIASREGKPQQEQRMQAVTILKEMEQATISVRDLGWTSFATFSASGNPLHSVIANSNWALADGTETVSGFSKQIVINDVYRDISGNIATSGGTIDPSTKKITSTVSWTKPSSSSLSSVLYLTRTQNLTQTQTTQTDFEAGTKTDVIVEETTGTGIPDNGQVQLSTGKGDWCNPSSYIVDTLTLPKPGRAIAAIAGSAPGIDDSVYIGTGDGAAGVSFANISVSDPQPPDPPTPAPAIAGTYSSNDKVNAVYIDNGYAFIATDATSNQVKIVRLSDYTLYTTINLGSNSTARGIYVSNSVLYVTSSDRIYVYNISDIDDIKQLPTTKIHGGGIGEQVVVIGTKIYVSVSDSNLGLQVFTINTGGSLADWAVTYWSSAKLGWTATSKGLAVNSTGERAYVAFTSPSQPSGFYVINTSSKGNNENVATYNANGMEPNGISLATADIAILVGSNSAEQYQAVSGLASDNPVRCGGMAVTGGATGVATVNQKDSDVYSYVISGAVNDQFSIIEGGNGGASSATGSFESSTIDASFSAAFNRFTANINQPSGTSIQMQVGVAQAPPPGTSCDGATFTYVGPNGNTSDYFTPIGSTISAQIPLDSYVPSYQNPARCFRYRAELFTTNPSLSPHLYDITTNYSP